MLGLPRSVSCLQLPWEIYQTGHHLGDHSHFHWFLPCLLGTITSQGLNVYSFPVAAAINYYKVGDLKEQIFIFTQFWRVEVQIQGAGGCIPSGGRRGEHVFASSSSVSLRLGHRPWPSLDTECGDRILKPKFSLGRTFPPQKIIRSFMASPPSSSLALHYDFDS